MKEVKAGAELLDSVRPGWWNEIDIEELKMSHPYRCILGQLYKEYVNGISELWSDGKLPNLSGEKENGFLPDLEDLVRTRSAWIKEINNRRALDKELEEV